MAYVAARTLDTRARARILPRVPVVPAVKKAVRALLWTYCLLTMLFYSPPVDARGQCHCPFCEPLSLRGR